MKARWNRMGIGWLGVLIAIIGIFGMDAIPKADAAGSIYYVSPSGDDSNIGTEASPWKTLKKAATTLEAGDTAIFEDGVYDSAEIIQFSKSGTEEAPITIKAKNKHQAKLLFAGLNTTSKIRLFNTQFISIEGFEITQDTSGTGSSDIFIDIRDCANCIINGNKIHGAGGKAIQGLLGNHVEIIHNELYNFNQMAIVLANMNSPIIADNEIREVSNGILTPAGTRSAQIYNNRITATEKPMTYGIVLGGSYPASVAYDSEGFEAYHAAAWNNVIVAETPGLIDFAFSFTGSTDSGMYHNVIVDTKYGVRYINGGGASAGWSPVPTSPKFYNNIFSGCIVRAIGQTNAPVSPEHDYNLYHDCAGAPIETNGQYGDPQFVNRLTDWRLQADSPALETGTVLQVNGYHGEPMQVFLDYYDKPRTEPVSMGIYTDAAPDYGDVLFTDDFEDGDNLWDPLLGSLATVEETPEGNSALTDPNASALSGIARSYAGSMEWESYEWQTKVTFNEYFHPSGWLTLYTRYTDGDNYYLLEIQGEKGYIGLKKKVAGVVTPLQEKTDWYPASDEWMDIKFIVNGNQLQIYINDHLELSGTDYELTNGGIAAAIYRSDILIDDVVVTDIEATLEEPVDPGPKPEPGGTYYVSPTGSDLNPGTEQQPWRTMAQAAKLAQRGDTVIFEDGLYIETQPVIFSESGREDERIVFKARNKHQAVIQFYNMPTTKILMRDTSYITLQDFEITQNKRGINTSDIIVHVREGSDHVHVIGNKIYHAFEEGVKGHLVTGLIVDGNEISDMTHEAVDFVNVTSSIIRNNESYEIGRVGVLAKGGSSDIQIYNNYFHNLYKHMFAGAIYLGGQTGASSTLDPSENGYEAWNMVAYNNVVVGEPMDGGSTIERGIVFAGSKDSAAYNNIVQGTKFGIYFDVPRNTAEHVGWEWNPVNMNPVFKNNVVMNTTSHAVRLVESEAPINPVYDYNLYYNNAIAPEFTEPNGVYADPYFANVNERDWHLKEGSPAISAGVNIPGFELLGGQMIDISADFDGNERGDIWDIGIYREDTYALVERPTTSYHVTGQQGENGWYTSDVTVELTAESNEAPVSHTEYRLSVVESTYGTTPSTSSFVHYVEPLTLTDGMYDLSYRSVDTLGNVEQEQTTRISVDQTAPMASFIIDGDDLEEVMQLEAGQLYELVTLASDDLSSVERVEVVLDGVSYEGSSVSFIAQPKVYTIVFTITDSAGNKTVETFHIQSIVSLSSLKMFVENEYHAGSLDSSLLDELVNSLEQAEIHLKNFQTQLQNATPQSITEVLKQKLYNQSQLLIGNQTSSQPTVKKLQQLVDDYEKNDAFKNEQAVKALNIHLSAVEVFEKQGKDEKVATHMEGFKMLLDHQLELEFISEEVYGELYQETVGMLE